MLHQLLETGHVGGEAALGAEEFREVGWEAEGVVEFEGHVARNAAVFDIGHRVFETLQSAVERLVEARFFLFESCADDVLAVFQFGKNSAHFAHQRFHERAEERLFAGKTKLAAVSHGAAEDAAEHVVAAVVAGHDAVGDGE